MNVGSAHTTCLARNLQKRKRQQSTQVTLPPRWGNSALCSKDARIRHQILDRDIRRARGYFR
jgi:hypothetical protein